MTPSSANLRPLTMIAAGTFIGLIGAPFIWDLAQNGQSEYSTQYTGPAIGDAGNPLAGKLVSDGKSTVRVDKASDGKSIQITDIKTDEDRQKWLSEQRDRPPTVVEVVNNSDTPLKTIVEHETVYWTAAMDQKARQEFKMRQTYHQTHVPIRYIQAIVPPAIGLGMIGIGIARIRKR
ncbi:hypothetical protein EBR96_07420 [bacterium]|nr:hypothetical protein [bacterium]